MAAPVLWLFSVAPSWTGRYYTRLHVRYEVPVGLGEFEIDGVADA